jgi:KipI family sensor histidine kinase inhibitor
VLALMAALDDAPPPGLIDLVPAYASVLARFDPLILPPMAMETVLRAALAQVSDAPLPHGRLLRIPVCYGGDAGPDLDEVARLLGMAPNELVRRHSAATYRVAFLGFLAGYPYLTGLPHALAVPRLATPRTHVPAGSVAIAERQAGIYPVESPGGWRILGRTAQPLFDPTQTPPALLRPGDRVRFYPSAEMAGEEALIGQNISGHKADMPGIPWLRVVRPGLRASVQDGGRVGYARYGVVTAGAADGDALVIGNALLANQPGKAAIEITGGDAEFEVLAPCAIAVTGAPSEIRVNGRLLPAGVAWTLAAGDTLAIGALAAGMRVYLCVAGGVAVSLVMGSRSTDARAGLGGFAGRPLRIGDVLHRECDSGADDVAGRILPLSTLMHHSVRHKWRLRVLPGQHAAESPGQLDALCAASFQVEARSDRVGVRLRRLDGPCLAGGQVLSEGVPRGAVQLPPDGEPVLLLADAQATGGYRVPAVVVSADLWQLGQLRPGDIVRFVSATMEEALAAWRRRAETIEQIGGQPSPARLLAGFVEWSDTE